MVGDPTQYRFLDDRIEIIMSMTKIFWHIKIV
jgi:hypothetical protein